jgi:hypothetical protein
VLWHQDAFFSLSEGWDPPPAAIKASDQWLPQFHLRFTPSQLVPSCNLGVVLCPGHATLSRAPVTTERRGATEVARIGQELVLIGQDGRIQYQDLGVGALAMLRVQGQHYVLGKNGLDRWRDS